MSKKLAAGADAILLDVKTGSGAFMKTTEQAVELARAMVSIGEHMGRRVIALITDMDAPLGAAIGNALEVKESADTLRGSGPDDLTGICIELSAYMLKLAGKGDIEQCRALAKDAIISGRAFESLIAMVKGQGGDISVIEDTSRLPAAPVTGMFKAARGGYITHMDTEMCGAASSALGAGRDCKDDPIDYSAGIVLLKKTGDRVAPGDTVAVLHTSDAGRLSEGEGMLSKAVTIGDSPPPAGKPVLAAVTKEGVTFL
jgi:pyrimidine-nucleoside phosphorylase